MTVSVKQPAPHHLVSLFGMRQPIREMIWREEKVETLCISIPFLPSTRGEQLENSLLKSRLVRVFRKGPNHRDTFLSPLLPRSLCLVSFIHKKSDFYEALGTTMLREDVAKWLSLSFVLTCRSLMLSVCSQSVAPLICKIPLSEYSKWFSKRNQPGVSPKVSGSSPASSSQDIWIGFCYCLKLCGFDICPLSIFTGY